MLRYKNVGHCEKTFYGVKFKPGETHDVTGYINDKRMIRVPTEQASSKVENKPNNDPKSEEKKSEEKKPEEKKSEDKKSDQKDNNKKDTK